MRTIARETLFKLLFSSQFTEEIDENLKAALYKNNGLDEKDTDYCNRMLGIIKENHLNFKKLVDGHSYCFPENRIFPADRSILLIALAEIFYADDIPDKVSVNEAANIASKYSSEKSASFITGILSTVITEKNHG